jgi:hypothetical protein
MLHFIELSQFTAEDTEATQALRGQMSHSVEHIVRWAEWRADLSGAHSWPDVTLINAKRLDWKQLKWVVNQCTAETIVLTGCQDSLLGLPVLPRVQALDELLAFMPGRLSGRDFSGSLKRIFGYQHRSGYAADTTPMPLKAH